MPDPALRKRKVKSPAKRGTVPLKTIRRAVKEVRTARIDECLKLQAHINAIAATLRDGLEVEKLKRLRDHASGLIGSDEDTPLS